MLATIYRLHRPLGHPGNLLAVVHRLQGDLESILASPKALTVAHHTLYNICAHSQWLSTNCTHPWM
jgi:hypothetical protein